MTKKGTPSVKVRTDETSEPELARKKVDGRGGACLGG